MVFKVDICGNIYRRWISSGLLSKILDEVVGALGLRHVAGRSAGGLVTILRVRSCVPPCLDICDGLMMLDMKFVLKGRVEIRNFFFFFWSDGVQIRWDGSFLKVWTISTVETVMFYLFGWMVGPILIAKLGAFNRYTLETLTRYYGMS